MKMKGRGRKKERKKESSPFVRVIRRVLDSQVLDDILHHTMTPGNNNIAFLVVIPDAFGDTMRVIVLAGVEGNAQVFREREHGVDRASMTDT